MKLGPQLLRYGLVGLANTAIGYGSILIGLAAGLGDYSANALGYALGLCFSFFANRKFTFEQKGKPTAAEATRFVGCFATSYSANLAVIAFGRAAGHAEQPLVHLTAMVIYSAVFFMAMRTVAFRQQDC
jgi:putative flippase GtrA